MDPKMDIGYVAPDEDSTLDDFDPLSFILPEEIIGIMDQMLCHEACELICPTSTSANLPRDGVA